MARRMIVLLAILATITIPSVAAAALTVPEQNAIAAAKQYLQFEAFSRLGLIQQLSAKAGSGFSRKLAVFAVAHITVNWDAEAVKAARQYLQAEPFSCSGLVQQLSATAGSQFTTAQAEYGAKRNGLC